MQLLNKIKVTVAVNVDLTDYNFKEKSFIMIYAKKTITMSDGNENVFHSWIPEQEVKAAVVLSHGMTEFAFRYNDLADFFCKNGIAVYAEDHRGHGETAALAEKNKTGMFGYLADKDGFFRVADDVFEEIQAVKDLYPGKKVFLLGHSFGSLVSQCVIEKYGEQLDGCILCATAGPRNVTVFFAKILASVFSRLYGRKKVSKFIDKATFGSYNSHIKNNETPFDWLSHDKKNVEEYVKHPWCGYLCTIGFFSDLFDGLAFIHKAGNMKKIPVSLPVHLIAGTEDPVGSYGKTVKKLFKIYTKNKMSDVSLKLWQGGRHELFNETNREEIKQETLDWLLSHI